ncbi:MAG: hypothetical protein R3C68_17190 [Myxococcota bacterium]
MLSRLGWNLVTILSIATLVGVGYFFVQQYKSNQEREKSVAAFLNRAEKEGPCVGLIAAGQLSEAGTDLERRAEGFASMYASRILKNIGGSGQHALALGAREHLIDIGLCQQIAMMADAGETHPMLTLLRFKYEADPCELALELENMLDSFKTHRSLLLKSLVEDVSRLSCLTPALSREVGVAVATTLRADPQAFDEFEESALVRLAGFLDIWAPLQSAQVACTIEALGNVSKLGNVIGCSPEHQRWVLPVYRYIHPLPAIERSPALPAGTEVFLLWREAERCDIRPKEGAPRLLTVACNDLQVVSGLDLAVLIERVEFGAARADMISGLLSYAGDRGKLVASVNESPARSWFAYDHNGRGMGRTHVISLQDIASQAGVALPRNPLRTFCRDAALSFVTTSIGHNLLERCLGNRWSICPYPWMSSYVILNCPRPLSVSCSLMPLVGIPNPMRESVCTRWGMGISLSLPSLTVSIYAGVAKTQACGVDSLSVRERVEMCPQQLG